MKSTKQDNRPAFQFYYKDYIFDLQGVCSLEAIGLWTLMLCRMWTSPKRGMLLMPNEAKHTSETLAKLTGEAEEKIKKIMSELEDLKVYDLIDGIPTCRKMYFDWLKEQEKKEAGRLGGLSKTEAEQGSKTKQNDAVEDEYLNKFKDIISLLNDSKYFNTILFKGIFVYSLTEAYPNIDIKRELKKMEAWLTSNPDRAKKNYKRFINNWISKVEDKNAANKGSGIQSGGKYAKIGTTI
jgi:uncharacterized protein YdaU (DUF1376 family)